LEVPLWVRISSIIPHLRTKDRPAAGGLGPSLATSAAHPDRRAEGPTVDTGRWPSGPRPPLESGRRRPCSGAGRGFGSGSDHEVWVRSVRHCVKAEHRLAAS